MFTDGLENVEAEDSVLSAASGLGFQVDVVSFRDSSRDWSVSLSGVPAAVSGNAEISFNIVVRGPSGKVTCSLLRNSEEIFTGEIAIPRWGAGVRVVTDTVDDSSKDYEYVVRIDVDDLYPENNRFGAVVLGNAPAARALVLSKRGEDSLAAKYIAAANMMKNNVAVQLGTSFFLPPKMKRSTM